MDIKIDKERITKIRKSKKLTQADMASRLNMSLRTYSDYENTSVKGSLSHLEVFRLSRTLNVVVSDLWNFIPHSVILFYFSTSDHSKWAKLLADGKFESLEVSGLPDTKRLREPLLKLVEVHEASKEDKKNEKLSSSIQRSFDCDDWVQELVAPKDETDVPTKIMAMRVPALEVNNFPSPHPDERSNEIIDDYYYNWSVKWHAKIDFTGIDPETKPIPLEYRSGPDSNVFFSEFDGWDIEYASNENEEDQVKAEIEKTEGHIKAALAARPDIRFQDEINIKISDNQEKEKDDEM